MRAREFINEDRQQLNEFLPIVAAEAAIAIGRGIMLGWEFVAPMLPQVGSAIGLVLRSSSSLLGSVTSAATELLTAIGWAGLGTGTLLGSYTLYKIYSSTEGAFKALVSLLGSAAKYIDEHTMLEIAAASVKYSIPLIIFVGLLYAGKELISSLLSDHKDTEKEVQAKPA